MVFEFAGHCAHAVDADAFEYVPDAHAIQAVPMFPLYCPAAQGLQVCPSSPECPGKHLQSDAIVLPAGAVDDVEQLVQTNAPAALKVFAEHSAHRSSPIESLYLPASQATHVEPALPK